jgi:hypothetical protein
MKPGSSIINVASDEAYGPQFMVTGVSATRGSSVMFAEHFVMLAGLQPLV